MKPTTPLPHNFFEEGLEAFIQSFRKRIEFFSKDFPVYIINTGDEVYLNNWRTAAKTKDIYEQTPRIVLDILDLQVNTDQLSSPHERGSFVMNVAGRSKKYSARFRRIPVTVSVSAKLTCDNILEQFKYLDLIFSLFFKVNTFSFLHMGNRQEGYFEFDASSATTERNVTLGQDTERRHRVINFTLQVGLQYQSFDYYDSESLMSADNVINTFIHNTEDINAGQVYTQQIPPEESGTDSQVITP